MTKNGSDVRFSPSPPPPPPHPDSFHRIFVASFRTFSSNALLAYNIRAGFSAILRLVSVLRSKSPGDALDLSKLFAEDHLRFRVEAVRMALAFGGTTGLYQLGCGCLEQLRGRADGWNDFWGGTLSGVAVTALEPERRRTMALYLMARAVQCLYNGAKKRGWIKQGFLDWPHGDSLLFGLSSAQIMYAYVMRPETLPYTYWNFIVRTGPISKLVLEQIRRFTRGMSVQVDKLNAFCRSQGMARDIVTSSRPARLPTRVLHPHTPSAVRGVLDCWVSGFQRGWPLYAALTFAPAIVLRFGRFARAPLRVLLRCTGDTLRSSVFLAFFVSGYLGCVTGWQNIVAPRPHRSVYWLSGFVASLSVLIEQKSKRAELALYVMPRAADSAFRVLCEHRFLSSLRHGEVLLFALSLGTVLYFYQHERESSSPMTRALLDRVLKDSPLSPLDRGLTPRAFG